MIPKLFELFMSDHFKYIYRRLFSCSEFYLKPRVCITVVKSLKRLLVFNILLTILKVLLYYILVGDCCQYYSNDLELIKH